MQNIVEQLYIYIFFLLFKSPWGARNDLVTVPIVSATKWEDRGGVGLDRAESCWHDHMTIWGEGGHEIADIC